MRINRVRAAAIAVAFVSAFALTACSTQAVAPKSDEYVCVYGPKEDGRQLVAQYPPGAKRADVDSRSQVISIPTSNRFYNMVKDDAIRDPGASSFITVNSKDFQEMTAQVAIRFTFKQDKICEWYTKHGRRNGDPDVGTDLGFNVRGNPGTGWASWLNENFGERMKTIDVRAPFSALTWEQLNLPNPEDIKALNAQLSELFTQQLNGYLGGEYFCGVTYDPTKPDVCPNIDVSITDIIQPTNQKLIENRNALQEIESNKALELARNIAAKEAEKSKQELLDAQYETDQKKARNELVICDVAKKAGVTNCADYIRAKNGVPAYQLPK